MEPLIKTIHRELLPSLKVESIDPHNPVVVHKMPPPWQLVGAGNYAAVFCHPDYPDQVVKIYAPGRPGFEEEVQVYQQLGSHPAFSECLYAEAPFLVLKRLYGITLYDCLHRGLTIPKQVIQDIDAALTFARSRGLHPHDVHGRNVMMHEGRGLVVDISDFLNQGSCSAWTDLKKAYYWIYRPLLAPFRIQVPYRLLDWVRAGYRKFRRLTAPLRQRSRPRRLQTR
ncbi:MAG TPA: serine/threonine protein kinase [Trichocoleus sp.]